MADVSIIVTAYNIDRYIEQCLESVAAQTLGDIEVLVVDDGSSDATPQKIVEFCEGDARFIPVLLAENSPGGVATAANAGLDRATARWVGFVDGDDYIEPTMFERLVDAAAACDADLAMCEYQEVVDGSGERRDPADAHRWAELTAPCYSWMSKPAGSSFGSSPCPGASCIAGACSRTMGSGSRSATASTRTTRSTGSR